MTRHIELFATCFFFFIFLSSFGAKGTAAQEAREVAQVDHIAVEAGSGSFMVKGGQAREERRITVFYHKPESFNQVSPVMMVIPGAGRNGDDYRDAWVRASERYGVLILAPSYPEQFYPEFWSYNLAGMTQEVTLDLSFAIQTNPEKRTLDDVREELESTIGMHELVGHSAGHEIVYKLVLASKAGMLTGVDIHGTSSVANRNPQNWIFEDFDRIFDAVKVELGLAAETYDLFGHSAGGQILHRLAIFHPNSKADQILAANSGWYAVPTFEQEFPYGLNGSGMAEDQLEAAFGSHLVVFLGEEDDADETRGSLRRTPEADRQGTHRLARGKSFYTQAREAAAARGLDFEWQIEVIPGIGHDYKRMSAAAAKYLYLGEDPK